MTGNQTLPPISPDVKEELMRTVENNIFMQKLGITIEVMERGYVKGKIPVTEEILNPYGSVHGGVLYSLADIIAGLAACTYGVFSSTIDGNMDYILPAMNTKYIICEAKEVRQGAHVSQYEAYLYDDKEAMVDKARFSFYMMNRPIVEKKQG